MKKIILFLYACFFISCNKSNIEDIAKENIETYLLSNSKGTFKIKNLDIIKIDTLTDLSLTNMLTDYYLLKSEAVIENSKKYRKIADEKLNLLRLSKYASGNSALTKNYDFEFKENFKIFQMYNDSLVYYNKLVNITNELKADSLQFQFYLVNVKYDLLLNDASIKSGDDLIFIMNQDLNIIMNDDLIKIAENKFLKDNL